MVVAIPSKLWTVEEFERLDTLGFFQDARYELLEGGITAKMGQNGPHLITVGLLTRALQLAFGEGYTVAQHSAYYLRPHNRPEPDLIVYPGSPRDYEPDWVGAENVVVAVEVADTRLDTAEAKIEMYARHGITEYWIVDIPARQLRVFRQPVSAEGTWKHQFSLGENDDVEVHGTRIQVVDFLPRPIAELREHGQS